MFTPDRDEVMSIWRHPLWLCVSRGRRPFALVVLLAGLLTLYSISNRIPTATPNGANRVQVGDDRRLLNSIADPDIIDKQVLSAMLQKDQDAVKQHEDEPKLLFGGSSEEVATVLVFCANRAGAIRNHLDQIIRLRPSASQFPVVVSQDGMDSSVNKAVAQYVNETQKIQHIQHTRPVLEKAASRGSRNYMFIAAHYKWALDKVFGEMGKKHVIVTEDDLDLAADFFSYFSQLRAVLTADPTVWCISAWNDNGGKDLTERSRSELLWRSDFFPGLGWMLSADTWFELSSKWPAAYWDDWMRTSAVRKGRVCIRPEVSRTSHNMKLAGKGTSGGLFKSYLSSITLPDKPVDFSLIDTSGLVKESYDNRFGNTLREAKLISLADLAAATTLDPQYSYRVSFSSVREWRDLADAHKLMTDLRSGIMRTAYEGVVTFYTKGVRVYVHWDTLNIEKFGLPGAAPFFYDPKWEAQSRFFDFAKMYCKPTRRSTADTDFNEQFNEQMFTGMCDPANPELREWFKKKNMLKKLEAWGEMIKV